MPQSRQACRRRGLGLLLWAGLAAPALPAAAEPVPLDHAEEYQACMTLARIKPTEALDGSEAWLQRGGGAAARHCTAVALFGLGRYEEAAEQLDRLAQEMVEAEPDLRAGVLAQAGQAWLLAEDAGRASAAQTAALALEPDNVELLVDRSLSYAQAERYEAALADLDRALELAAERPDLLVFRASALRHLGQAERARADLERALARAPDHAEGLLERGILRAQAGDAAGARADWRRVIAVAPGTPAAGAAQDHLERLGAKD